jgi:hypothetical protein
LRDAAPAVLTFLLLALCCAPLDAQDPPTPEEPESRVSPDVTFVEEESEDPFHLSGYVSLSYRGRKRSGDNDEDLYGFLSLDGGKAEKDDVTFHLFGRGTFDLDDDVDAGGNPFYSLNDLGGDELDLKLYDAYVDLRRSFVPTSLGMRRVRIGRQTIFAGYTYLLDGIRLDLDGRGGCDALADLQHSRRSALCPRRGRQPRPGPGGERRLRVDRGAPEAG